MTVATLAALAGALFAVGPTGPAPSQLAAREAFDRGRTAFGRAEYQRAIELLHPLLYPDVQLDSEGEVVQAHRMLGVAYLFENQPDEARREFRKLLELRHDYRFDPLLDPQRVVDFFNGVLKEEQATIDAIEEKRRKHDEDIAKHRRDMLRLSQPPSVLRYERHSYAVNFIPFGAGQFQNGQRGKGWFFFGTETGLAAISLGAFATNFTLYGLSPHRHCNDMPPPPGVQCQPGSIDHSQEDKSRALFGVQLVSGGLFWAVAIWGVIDAIRNHQTEVPLQDETGGNGKIARAGRSGARFTLSPDGLGAAWTF